MYIHTYRHVHIHFVEIDWDLQDFATNTSFQVCHLRLAMLGYSVIRKFGLQANWDIYIHTIIHLHSGTRFAFASLSFPILYLLCLVKSLLRYHTSDTANGIFALSQMTTWAVVLLERRDTFRDVVSVRIESQLWWSLRPMPLQRFWAEVFKYELQQHLNHLKGGNRLEKYQQNKWAIVKGIV